MAQVTERAGVATLPLPPAIRRRRGLVFAFNYGETDWPIPVGGEPVLGIASVAPQSLVVWRH